LALLLAISLCACGQKAADEEIPSSSTTWQEQYDLGIRYLSDGNYEEAIIAFTAAIEINPKQAPAYVGRGDAYIGLGETEENLAAAQADYEAAIELDETNAQAYLGLADVYIRQGEFDKAREVLEAGLEKTRDPDILTKLEEFDSGNITDSSGLSRHVTFYDSEGNLLFYATYTYPNGLENITTYDPEGNQIAHGKMIQDEHGNIVEGYGLNSDTGELFKVIEEYDENGNWVGSESYEPDGTKSSRSEFIYNDQHQIVKEYRWDKDGRSYIWAYTYDAAGNRTEQITCDLNGEPLYVSERYSYDSNGNKIEELHYYGPNEDWGARRVYEYDNFGNEISCTYLRPDGTIDNYEEFSYEYDDNGNIIGGTFTDYRNGEVLSSRTW
jgi:YD repeat-containing protein